MFQPQQVFTPFSINCLQRYIKFNPTIQILNNNGINGLARVCSGVNPADFTRGLEEFCMLQRAREEAVAVNNLGAPCTSDLESQNDNHGLEPNRQTLQMRKLSPNCIAIDGA